MMKDAAKTAAGESGADNSESDLTACDSSVGFKENLTDTSGICVALFNLTDATAEVSVTLEEVAASLPVELAASLCACVQAGKGLKLRELWSGQEKITDGTVISETVEAHGAALFSISIA